MDSNPYPSQRHPIDLSTGRAIVFYNVVVFVKDDQDGAEKSMGLQYRTDLRSELQAERVADATALVQIYERFAADQGIARISAQICNTEAAAAMREPPEQIIYFARTPDGRWVHDAQ